MATNRGYSRGGNKGSTRGGGSGFTSEGRVLSNPASPLSINPYATPGAKKMGTDLEVRTSTSKFQAAPPYDTKPRPPLTKPYKKKPYSPGSKPWNPPVHMGEGYTPGQGGGGWGHPPGYGSGGTDHPGQLLKQPYGHIKAEPLEQVPGTIKPSPLDTNPDVPGDWGNDPIINEPDPGHLPGPYEEPGEPGMEHPSGSGILPGISAVPPIYGMENNYIRPPVGTVGHGYWADPGGSGFQAWDPPKTPGFSQYKPFNDPPEFGPGGPGGQWGPQPGVNDSLDTLDALSRCRGGDQRYCF